MPNIFSNFLEDNAFSQAASVQAYRYNQEKVWLKKASKRHPTWIYLPMRWFSKLFGLQMLAPVPNYGGEEAIACEISRIQSLRKLGVAVPEILAYRSDAFLLRDAAKSGGSVTQLESALKKQKDSAEKLELYAKAIQSIDDIHQKKAYLSEAFARNILIDESSHFSFIDFETDPGRVLPLNDCQTRDWLCFIFSTARCFEDHELDEASSLLAQALDKNIKSFQDVCRVGRKLKWLLRLKPENIGNDGKRLKKCIYLLNKLNDKKPLPMI